jgi:hypothetical protein
MPLESLDPVGGNRVHSLGNALGDVVDHGRDRGVDHVLVDCRECHVAAEDVLRRDRRLLGDDGTLGTDVEAERPLEHVEMPLFADPGLLVPSCQVDDPPPAHA